MRKQYFKNCEELSNYMVDKAQNGYYTVAVLFYNNAIDLLCELMRYDDINIESIDIQPVEYKGYGKEYYVSIADDMIVSVEPAFVGGRYLNAEADLTLINGDASSTIIKDISDNKCREIYIGIFDDEENYDCKLEYDNKTDELDNIFENAELVKDKNNNINKIKIDAISLFKYLFD